MSTAAIEKAIRENIGHGRHEAPGKPCFCGLPGWMPGVEHIPISWSIKHGSGAQITEPSGQYPDWIEQRIGKMRPVAIADHIMVGHLSTMVDWALNRGSSISKIIAHFGIDSKPASWSGTMARIVQFWPANSPGIHVSSLANPTAKVALARLNLPYGANTYTVGKEHAGTSVDLKDSAGRVILAAWERWPDPMTEASLAVDRYLYGAFPTLGLPSRDSLTGHYEYDARNRINDPAAEGERDIWPRDEKLRRMGINVAAQAAARRTYTVQRGDVLSVIASRHGVATSQLAAWNNITNPNLIEVGQVLYLEGPVSAPAPTPVPAPAPAPPPARSTDVARVRAELDQIEAGVADISRALVIIRADVAAARSALAESEG